MSQIQCGNGPTDVPASTLLCAEAEGVHSTATPAMSKSLGSSSSSPSTLKRSWLPVKVVFKWKEDSSHCIPFPFDWKSSADSEQETLSCKWLWFHLKKLLRAFEVWRLTFVDPLDIRLIHFHKHMMNLSPSQWFRAKCLPWTAQDAAFPHLG